VEIAHDPRAATPPATTDLATTDLATTDLATTDRATTDRDGFVCCDNFFRRRIAGTVDAGGPSTPIRIAGA
jgi:hypothetical protein